MELSEMCSTRQIREVTFYVGQDVVDTIAPDQQEQYYSVMFSDTEVLWRRLESRHLGDEEDTFFWLLMNDENAWLDEYDTVTFTVKGNPMDRHLGVIA